MPADPNRAPAPSRPTLDPGDPLRTPAGTGPLGHPIGNGDTWADPAESAPADGTAGAAGAGVQDGTGSR
jgi:hypothetical protein